MGVLRPANPIFPVRPVHPAVAARWWARPRVAAVRGAAVAVFASRQSVPAPTLSACAGLEVTPAPVPAEVAAVAPAAARERGAVLAAAVELARAAAPAPAGETERWAAPVVLTASSGRRSAAPAESAWQARVAAVFSADPPGVGVEPAAATLVGPVRDVSWLAAAARAASPVAAWAASPGAAHLSEVVAARPVVAVAGRRAEIPAGARALDRPE